MIITIVHVFIYLFYLPVNFQTLITENKMISKMTKGWKERERGREESNNVKIPILTINNSKIIILTINFNNFKIIIFLLVLCQPVSVWYQSQEKATSF